MSDITKCDTKYCPSATRCWRKLAKSSAHGFQSYAHFRLPPGADRCADFWPIDKEPMKYDEYKNLDIDETI